MHTPHPASSYRQVATRTATPGQLVLMLFDGAIRFLERARQSFAEEDPAVFNHGVNANIQRAQAIIRELDGSLNMAAGGEVSANFRRLYDYLDRRLQESNLHKQEEGICEVVERLATLRAAWAEMLQREDGPALEPGRAALFAAG
jgi:flagellar secretion chaperone FliS